MRYKIHQGQLHFANSFMFNTKSIELFCHVKYASKFFRQSTSKRIYDFNSFGELHKQSEYEKTNISEIITTELAVHSLVKPTKPRYADTVRTSDPTLNVRIIKKNINRLTLPKQLRLFDLKLRIKPFGITLAVPPRWNRPCRVEGAYYQEVSTQVRQREELVGATQLRSIRTNRSSLICRCQGPDSR